MAFRPSIVFFRALAHDHRPIEAQCMEDLEYLKRHSHALRKFVAWYEKVIKHLPIKNAYVLYLMMHLGESELKVYLEQFNKESDFSLLGPLFQWEDERTLELFEKVSSRTNNHSIVCENDIFLVFLGCGNYGDWESLTVPKEILREYLVEESFLLERLNYYNPDGTHSLRYLLDESKVELLMITLSKLGSFTHCRSLVGKPLDLEGPQHSLWDFAYSTKFKANMKNEQVLQVLHDATESYNVVGNGSLVQVSLSPDLILQQTEHILLSTDLHNNSQVTL